MAWMGIPACAARARPVAAAWCVAGCDARRPVCAVSRHSADCDQPDPGRFLLYARDVVPGNPEGSRLDCGLQPALSPDRNGPRAADRPTVPLGVVGLVDRLVDRRFRLCAVFDAAFS